MSAPVASYSSQGHRWNLQSLYNGIEDPRLDSDFAESVAEADAFAAAYRGRIESGQITAAELAEAIAKLEALVEKSSKPGLYASLMHAGDTQNPAHGALYAETMERGSEIRVRIMFFSLELQAMDDAKMDALMADPALATYRHYLQVTRAFRPYKLSETEETLLERTANTGVRAWQRLHDELTAAHVFNYKDPATGETEELALEQVVNRLREANRDVRVAAAAALTEGLKELEKTIAFTYNTILADKKLEDELRGFATPEASRHLENELEAETVAIVTDLCQERSDLVARFYKTKRQLLGLDELTHVDRYAPLFEAEERISYEAARTMVVDAFAAFHPEMGARADEFFAKNWIDAEARPGKTGGAFCSYNTTDTHPVVLMTYLDKMGDVGTLAHELGHGVHASLSRAQSYVNFHGTLPLAELASIFGEMLVFERLVAEASDRDKLALYAEKLEGMFASVHRQAAFYRFEQTCHRLRREEGEISAETFRDLYQAELQSMFEDGLTLGDDHKVWWAYIGHFFFAPFYVYAYAFGELLTLAIYQMAKNEGPGFAEKYVDVLQRGGSETPAELMAHLGVDLGSPAFWQGGFAAMEAMVEEFEALAQKVGTSA